MKSQQFGRWPGEQERQPITDAIGELWEIASRDCYGYDVNDGEECQCERCVCSRAVVMLREVLYPEVRSLTPERLETGYAERLFFEAWKATNIRQHGINGGRATLELLTKELGPVTQRDMDVATAVVQWLGTSCGSSFLFEVQRQIERVRKEGSEKIRGPMSRVSGDVNSIGMVVPKVSPS